MDSLKDEEERTKEPQLLILMNCLFVRKDLSQERTVPVILRENSRWKWRIVWLMEAKAGTVPDQDSN